MPTNPAVLIDVEMLVLEGAPRSLIDDDYARALAQGGAPLPAIIVHAPTLRVVDGRHRVLAATLRRERQIAAQMCSCDASEIFALAVAANAERGRPIPIADRKRYASALLAEHPEWSTRRIAVASALAPGTVGKLRGAAAPTEVRIGRNGRRRAVDSGRGRRIASEVLAAEPGISLREAARKAGISPGTVRDVRNRMPQTGTRAGRRPIAGGRDPGRHPPPHAVGHLLVAKLCMDPALRYTSTGRRLLAGLLAAGVFEDGDLAELARSLPAHCVALIAAAAGDCARTWQEFADAVRRQQAFQDTFVEWERVGRL